MPMPPTAGDRRDSVAGDAQARPQTRGARADGKRRGAQLHGNLPRNKRDEPGAQKFGRPKK
eukprot:6842259-Pyramimonas_sp.AAC.1